MLQFNLYFTLHIKFHNKICAQSVCTVFKWSVNVMHILFLCRNDWLYKKKEKSKLHTHGLGEMLN